LEVKRLKLALCAEETSHEVTRITLSQLKNTLQEELTLKKNSFKITDEASSQPMNQQRSSNREIGTKIFKDILYSIRYFTYPLVSLKQHYKITNKLFLGMDGLSHLTLKTFIGESEFKNIWLRASAEVKELIIFMWHIGDLHIEKGIVETYIASPICYIIRYITRSYQMMMSHHRNFFTNELLIKPIRPQRRNDYTNMQIITRFLSKNKSRFQNAIIELKEFDKEFFYKIKDRWLDFLQKHYSNFPMTIRKVDFIESFQHMYQNTKTQIFTYNEFDFTVVYPNLNIPHHDPRNFRYFT